MRRHRITIPYKKPDFKFNLPTTIKLPTLYEVRRMSCP